MPTEWIEINGQRVETLKELLCPHVTAVFVGLNPSPVSVAAGHYYQGHLGRRLWQRLQAYQITGHLPEGREDEAAFKEGFGFADVIRRPTAGAEELAPAELQAGARDLLRRLNENAPGRPLTAFVFVTAANVAEPVLHDAGYRTHRLPSPFAPAAEVKAAMTEFGAVLWATRRCLC